MNYFKKIGMDRLTNDYEENVLKFMNDDSSLLKYGKIYNYPNSYIDALYMFDKFNNEKNRDNCIRKREFLNFKNNNYPDSGDYYVLKQFRKRLLGYLGEYYFYNQYIKNNNVRFVSRKIGNGTGYDMYINNGDIFEYLYEVKTTNSFQYNSDDDIIFITPNEYACMEKVIKSNLSAKYYVSRLFYNNNNFNELILKYIGGDTLKCGNIEYNIDYDYNNNQYLAKRRK